MFFIQCLSVCAHKKYEKTQEDEEEEKEKWNCDK